MSRNLRWFLCFLFLGFLMVGCMQDVKKKTDAERLPKFAEGATYVGSEACADCHDELVEKFKDNIHAKIADFEVKPSMVSKGCEACHGPASKHVEEEDPSLIVNPAKVKPSEANALCLQCHTDGELMDWHGSEHDLNNIACISCHTVHGEQDKVAARDKLGYRHKYQKDKLLKKPEPELCFTCHKDVLAQTRYPNHHPVKEGKLVCSDCHNPHGSEVSPLLRTDETKNELCLQCHQDKSGPYVFEHAPVTEDCTICHTPHGSVADNLLKQNEPYLCIQCHGLHFHSTIVPDTQWIIANQEPGHDCPPGTAWNPSPETGGPACVPATTAPDAHAMQKIMTTKCTECHSAIHGSDLPSLAAPGGGSRLTR